MDALWSDYIWPLAIIVAESVLLIALLLIAVAYLLYADRKIWAAVQIRRGPNVVGPWGLFQSFADFIKFVLKEPIIPAGANKGVFLIAPLVTFTLAERMGIIDGGVAVGHFHSIDLRLFATAREATTFALPIPHLGLWFGRGGRRYITIPQRAFARIGLEPSAPVPVR